MMPKKIQKQLEKAEKTINELNSSIYQHEGIHSGNKFVTICYEDIKNLKQQLDKLKSIIKEWFGK